MFHTIFLFLLIFIYEANCDSSPTANATQILSKSENIIAKGSCGQTISDPNRRKLGRIVGGVESKPNSIPWIVSLRRGITSAKKHFCGGTLIRVSENADETDIVITAAHCNEKRWRPFLIEVAAGKHDVTQVEPGEVTAKAEKFISHEDFNSEHITNDIAIIKLATPIKFGRAVQPVCLPPAGDRLPDNAKFLVAGWGYTKENEGKSSVFLQQLEIPLIATEKCTDYYQKAKTPEVIQDAIELCAGFPEGGKDSCQGDSGGPLLRKSPKGYELDGIVSFGEGCARQNLPGIYTRVAAYVDWINKKIGELSDIAKAEAKLSTTTPSNVTTSPETVDVGSQIKNLLNRTNEPTNKTAALEEMKEAAAGENALNGSQFEKLVNQEPATEKPSGARSDNGPTPSSLDDDLDIGEDIPKGSCGHTMVDPMITGGRIERGKIVGGDEATANSLPWIVSIQRGPGNKKKHFCGGTLIRVSNKSEETDIIITASHCSEEGWEPKMIKVVAGAQDLNQQQPGQQESVAAAFHTHPDFSLVDFHNDIAIMKLAKPIRFGPTAQPACLPKQGERMPANVRGLVAGWGLMRETAKVAANSLQLLVIPVMTKEKCDSFYTKLNPPTPLNETIQFCAGYERGGKDSCKGDSGGPVVFKEPNKGYMLRGVVSYGEGCARPELPGVYTLVSNYMDWIWSKVKELSDVAKRDS